MVLEILLLSGLAFGIYHQKRQPKTNSNKSQALTPKLSNLSQKGKTNLRAVKNVFLGSNKSQALKPKLSRLYQKAKTSLRAVKKVLLISFSGGEVRHQQLKQMVTRDGDNQAKASEKKLDRNINLSIGLMGLALIGTWFYAPLLPIAAAGALYLFYPLCHKFYQELKKGRITTELLEIIGITSFLITGYIFLGTLITFFGLLNMKLLARTEDHSQGQLIDVFSQKRQSVWVRREGMEVEIPLKAVQKQDIVVVNAGEIIPVDGIITEGLATIDQHSLTGESQPVEKEVGAQVLATTLVLAGRILIQVEKTGTHTNAAKIGHILQQTQAFKENLRLRGKQTADRFVAPTLLASGLTLPLLGSNAAMAILWSGFGYNMQILGPISVLNFLHMMAKNGLLIKDGRSLEMLQQIDTVVFDKTGTLTLEQPQLCHLYPQKPFNEETLLTYAAAAEYRQTHPIAKAILTAAEQRGLDLPVIEEAAYQVGYGIEVKIETTIVQVGSARFMQQQGIHLPTEIQDLKTQCDANGHSLVYVALNKNLAGALELQPSIRPEAKEIIHYLKAQGISLYIISGDHEQPTRRLAQQLDIEHYFAETLPDKKAQLIAKLRASGKFVAFIGDGINDAIALKQANVSISLRGASTAATDTAQIILMDGNLNKLKSLFEIAKAFEANMRTNYLTSMVPGVICLGGVFLFHMGVVGGLIVYYTAKLVGLTNTMLPLVKHENSDKLTFQSKPKPLDD
jgi:heavy metal translocating P-type ATPase